MLARNRKFADSPLEGDGFEIPVPRRALMRRHLASRELVDADTVNSFGDHDLGVFGVANIAPEDASAALPAHSIAGAPSRTDPSGARRYAPGLALARFARRAPG